MTPADTLSALAFAGMYALAMVLEVVAVLRCHVHCAVCRAAMGRGR